MGVRKLENNMQIAIRTASADGAGALAMADSSDTVHVSIMHYSFEEDLSAFYFSTDRTSKKIQILRQSEGSCSGALAIGTGDDATQFLQFWGVCEILTEPPMKLVDRHVDRNPSAAEFRDDSGTLYVKFVPNSGRLTDYTRDDFQINLPLP